MVVVSLKDISILIPFRSDNGPRDKAFRWVTRFYETVYSDAEICVGTCDTQFFSKSKAVNNAAKKATRDIFIIADADMIYDPKCITESIMLLKNHAWVIPYTRVLDISQHSTQRLLLTEPNWPIKLNVGSTKRPIRTFGGVNVVPRKNFDAVGGWDERFIGWGGADDAFCMALDTICGKHTRVNIDLFHLWHKPTKAQGNPNYNSNYKLVQRYRQAYGKAKVMEKLINERNK
ncbi:MAG: galactosyltransferase-related protein [Bacillota bacterium]